MATASEVARYIVKKFQEAGDPVTNLKLQKLLYYIQGWSLALRGTPAFKERLEAWVHGPVQPGVYGQYKAYRWNPICDEVEVPEIDNDLVALIEDVLESYGGDTGYELEMRTHRETPWLKARGGLAPDEESNAVLAHEDMLTFFRKLAENGETQ